MKTAVATGLRWVNSARQSRRLQLWLALAALVLMVLGLLVFLTARYEASQRQAQVEAAASNAAQDLRQALNRQVQQFQALNAFGLNTNANANVAVWQELASQWLLAHRMLRVLEWRDKNLIVRARLASPYAAQDAIQNRNKLEQPGLISELGLACEAARRQGAPNYSSTYFNPNADGTGAEQMELCLPMVISGQLVGFTVAVYGLQDLLSDAVSPGLQHGQQIAFTEADGSRLAMIGRPAQSQTRFVGTHLLDLPGNTLVLRMERGGPEPDALPNLVTVWVTALSIALLAVLALLLVDMQRRQRAELGLAQALAFRKAMEDSLSTGLRARDLAGRISYVNPAFCALVGYSAEQLVGHAPPDAYWPSERVADYLARQAQRFASGELLTGKAREGFESEFRHASGHVFPVLIIEAPLIDAKGVQSGWMSAVVDQSETRKAEAAARATDERLSAAARLATVGEMASLLSHELNQPLAAISSYAQGALNLIAKNSINTLTPGQKLIRTSFLDDQNDLGEALQRISAQAERAGKVIRSVNAFVRRREHQREQVSAQSLLDAVAPLVQLYARQTRTRVQLTAAPSLPPLLCDRTLVEQVLLNLARNGMQAMDDDPSEGMAQRELRIGIARAEGAWARCTVADHGPGIDADAAQHLFTQFFTTKSEGMGLGLSLCRTVVEQHGGTLRFEPNQPRGTVFLFTLPLFIT